MRRTANGRPLGVLQGGTGKPNEVVPPQPPQVPQKRMAKPVQVQQTWRLNQ